MPPRLGLHLGTMAVLATLACGCSATHPVPLAADPRPTPTPTFATPTPTQAPSGPGFAQPSECRSMLSAERLAEFEGAGRVLLGGPGGRYGGEYLIDETPEELAGGITCIWGDESDPATTITISVAPLTPETRPAVIADLRAQGLNEQQLDDLLRFGQLGDTVSSPAVLNVLRDDSWISIIDARGGETVFDRVVTLGDEVARAVYGVP